MFSKTGIGAVITLIFTVLAVFGVELPEGAAPQAVEAVTQLIGIGLIVWGQLQRKDLVAGILRK